MEIRQEINQAIKIINSSNNVTILQGAGLSTASGIPDYRSPGGLFDYLRRDPSTAHLTPEKVLSKEFFKKDPTVFYKFQKDVFLKEYKSNNGHDLARILYDKNKLIRVHTQNVDGLQNKLIPECLIIEFHGTNSRAICSRKKCGQPYPIEEYKNDIANDVIPTCKKVRKKTNKVCGNCIKPAIVLYGESISMKNFKKAEYDMNRSDLVIIIGTSLQVYPFAGLLEFIDKNMRVIVINREIPSTYPEKLKPYTTFVLGEIEEICKIINLRIQETK